MFSAMSMAPTLSSSSCSSAEAGMNRMSTRSPGKIRPPAPTTVVVVIAMPRMPSGMIYDNASPTKPTEEFASEEPSTSPWAGMNCRVTLPTASSPSLNVPAGTLSAENSFSVSMLSSIIVPASMSLVATTTETPAPELLSPPDPDSATYARTALRPAKMKASSKNRVFTRPTAEPVILRAIACSSLPDCYSSAS